MRIAAPTRRMRLAGEKLTIGNCAAARPVSSFVAGDRKQTPKLQSLRPHTLRSDMLRRSYSEGRTADNISMEACIGFWWGPASRWFVLRDLFLGAACMERRLGGCYKILDKRRFKTGCSPHETHICMSFCKFPNPIEFVAGFQFHGRQKFSSQGGILRNMALESVVQTTSGGHAGTVRSSFF